MNSQKHTPGPWEVGCLDHAGQRIVRGEHIEICTCWHHSVGSIEKEMEANARLIAAAPDMLRALETLVAFFDTTGLSTEFLTSARAAISKATTEGDAS